MLLDMVEELQGPLAEYGYLCGPPQIIRAGPQFLGAVRIKLYDVFTDDPLWPQLLDIFKRFHWTCVEVKGSP